MSRPRINPQNLPEPATRESSGRNKGQFRPGESGNPNGRPAGSRPKLLAALDGMGDEIAIQLFRRLAWEALFNGDMKAIELLARRIWPERKGRPVEMPLPDIENIEDIKKANSIITAAMARGDISPEEAASMAGVLNSQDTTTEIADIKEELVKLKEQIDALSRSR